MTILQREHSPDGILIHVYLMSQPIVFLFPFSKNTRRAENIS